MRTTLWVLAGAVFFPWLVGGAEVGAQEQELGDAYLARLLDVWQQDSSADDVEALVSLVSEHAIYEHPRVRVRIVGRRAIADAMTAFLGTSRDPRATGVETVSGPGVLVLGFDLVMEVQQGAEWSLVQRRQVIVLEISEGRIVRVSDHW